MQVLDAEEEVRLLTKLVGMTQSKELAWVPRTDFIFSCETGRFTFVISSRDRDDLHPYTFAVFAVSGTGSPVHETESEGNGSDDVVNLLGQLYFVAKRQALKLDTLAKDIFDDLAMHVEPF